MKKIWIALGIVAAVVLAGGIAVKMLYIGTYEYEPARVNIPAGASDDSIGKIMTDALGKDFGSKVERVWKLRGGTAFGSHGSYLIEPGTSALRAGNNIAKGRQTPVRFTFNNVHTMGELAARVAAQMETDSAAFRAAADSILSAEGLTTAQQPAAFIPDTHEFYWTASAPYIVNRLFAERKKFWNEERRAKAEALGLTPEDVHTLASIVEGETNKADERGMVARLYLNRLQKDMPLQADPTVKFAVGDRTLRRITGKHLKVESPYNTYINRGLPPGPIAIPESATLEAVLTAPQHNYLYMCAKSDFSGYHDFAADYGRHRINAARYHRKLAERGIE